MNIAKTYGSIVRRRLGSNPQKAGKLIRTGLHLEGFRVRRLQGKEMPKAYRYLNYKSLKLVADALDHPETYAWTNIFAPVELLRSFGLTCVSMECLASYLSGFYLEDYFIDRAENTGIAPTLCAYHKNFIGAVEEGIVPLPVMSVTTSMVCDGNINTFRYTKERFGVDDFVLDVPHEDTPEAEEYLVSQLKELITILEAKTGRTYDPARLKAAIRRENESRKYYQIFLEKRRTHAYPNTLTLVLFMLFATHLDIGSPWSLKFFQMLAEDIDNYPADTAKRLFWVHLTPYAQPTLRKYLNFNRDYAIVCDDFNMDFMEQLDPERPLHALAHKMIANIYNGDFTRKSKAIAAYVQQYDMDAVVEFCHWGCKQSCGGAMMLKEEMRKIGMPMLILDGDALDRRNCHDGQIRTRFEAFLELLRREHKSGTETGTETGTKAGTGTKTEGEAAAEAAGTDPANEGNHL